MSESPAQSKRSVFNPVEQRLFGLVGIAEGLATVVLGKHGPTWSLKVAMWGARRAHRRSQGV